MTQPDEPVTRYASLVRLKAALKLTDDDRDELLMEALDVASRQIDNTCGRRFWGDVSATIRSYRLFGRVLVDDDAAAVLLDDIAHPDDLVVELRDRASRTWRAVDDYDPGPDNAWIDGRPVTLLRRHDWSGDRIRITARHGWPALPAEVAMATRIQAHRLYKRKDSPEGIAGNAEWGTVRLSRVDPDVRELIAHLIIPGVG